MTFPVVKAFRVGCVVVGALVASADCTISQTFTSLARANLVDDDSPRLDNVAVTFRQQGSSGSSMHFGCRIVQANDGNLFLTLGEQFTQRDQAQNLGNHLGKIVRVRPDGTAPLD